MNTRLSARLAKLESDAERAGVRYVVSSRVLSGDEWQLGSDLARAEDCEPEPIMTEAEWIAAHCDPSGASRQ